MIDRDLTDTINKDDISQIQLEGLKKLLEDYNDVFAFSDKELKKGCSIGIEHTIQLSTNKPIKCAPYRVSPDKKEHLRKHIQNLLENGIIRESSSPFASPIVMVSKSDGSYRFCADFRRINAVTTRDVFPLPRIDDTLDCLAGSQFFSTLDLRSGFFQIPLSENSKKYTAIIVHDGLYEFNRLPQGLANSPATFQRVMEQVLRGLTWSKLLVYLDDIIIFSPNFESHLLRLKEVFDRFRAVNLKLKPSKCRFLHKQVQFLGHVISAEGIKPSPDKTRIVEKYPAPKSPKEIRQFLGLCGFFRRFIKDFAAKAVPLNRLLRKNTTFQWNETTQEAFEYLRDALVSPPVLAYPDFSKQFDLHCDASGDAIGQILTQQYGSDCRVIAYSGRALTPPERNYTTTEQEGLAVVDGVRKFQHYLHGRHFVIWSDHSSLTWLFKNNEIKTGRVARWATLLQGFDFEIKFRPGRSNQHADAISRMPMVASADRNQAYDPINLRERQRKDPELIQLILFLEDGTPYTGKVPPELAQKHADEFFLNEDGILYKKADKKKPYDPDSLLVVPDSLRSEILLHHHDSHLAAHFGAKKTESRIRKFYYWPLMASQIKDWCSTCEPCLKRKRDYGRRKAPLNPIPIGLAFDRIAVDLLGPLPLTKSGNRYIIVFSDYKTKWPEAAALPSGEAHLIAREFFRLIISRHGTPHTLLSDLGRNFMSNLLKEIYALMDVKKVNTTAYRPQTDGLVERFNGILTQAITMFCSANQDDWDVYIDGILLGYRISDSNATNESPFFLLYGRHARLPVDTKLLPPSKLSADNSVYRAEIVKNLAEAQKLSAQINQKHQENMKTRSQAK